MTTRLQVDKYNIDTVVVTDGVGTATPAHFPSLKVNWRRNTCRVQRR